MHYIYCYSDVIEGCYLFDSSNNSLCFQISFLCLALFRLVLGFRIDLRPKLFRHRSKSKCSQVTTSDNNVPDHFPRPSPGGLALLIQKIMIEINFTNKQNLYQSLGVKVKVQNLGVGSGGGGGSVREHSKWKASHQRKYL